MLTVIGGGEDPEEVHAVEVIGAEKIQFAVRTHSVRAEFESAAFVAGVHDNGKERARLRICVPVTSDLHTDHGTCQDHMDGFRNIDQLAHTEFVEQRLEMRTVGLLTYSRVKSDSGADVEKSFCSGLSSGIRAM